MNQPSPTTEKTEPTPAKRRLHRSTFMVAGLVLLVGVILNCGGNYDQQEYKVAYGWPWSYALHNPTEQEYNPWTRDAGELLLWSPWRIDLLQNFYAISIVANLLVVAVVLLAFSMLWEWRRRKVKRWYQFTIADWLMVSTAMALCYAGYEHLYRDKYACEQLRNKFKELNTPLQFQVDEGLETIDGVFYWAWDVLRLPYEARPYKINNLNFSLDDANQTFSNLNQPSPQQVYSIPQPFWNQLGHFQSLEACFFDIRLEDTTVEIPEDAFASLNQCPHLDFVSVNASGVWFTDKHVFPLSKVRSLKMFAVQNNLTFRGDRLSHLNRLVSLALENTGLNDNGLAELAELSQLGILDLTWNESTTPLGWSNLKRLQSVKRLKIASHSIDGIGVEAIGNLTELEELDLTTWKAVSEDSWKALANLKKLQKLHIDCPTFDDQALAALENLSELKTLELDNTSLTRRAFATLKKMKGLHSLDMFNARNAPRIAYPHNSNLHIKIGESGLTAEDEIEFRAIAEPN